MQSFLLKAGATLLTLLSAVASAAYVGGHIKNGTAPLHPPVITAQVHQSNVEAVTSTYAS